MSHGHADEERERLLTGYTGRLLLAVSLGWAAIQAGRLVLSPLLPAVMGDLASPDWNSVMARSPITAGRSGERTSRPA